MIPISGTDFPSVPTKSSVTREYETTSPTVALIATISALENERPRELDLCLYDFLDTDALNQLFDMFDSQGRDDHNANHLVVTFIIGDYWVCVRGDNTVTVTELG